jgi:hypothetical protein
MEITDEPAAKVMKGEKVLNSTNANEANIAAHEMTSSDYYFDSYAHFGIHEGIF